MSGKGILTFSRLSQTPDEQSKNIRVTEEKSIDKLLEGFKKNDKYEHLTLIGEGGMGVVTLSRDKNTLRKVAIKTLNEKLLNNHEAIIRFTEEAQITAQLEHPNIIPVYEMGMDSNNAPFYSMKYVKGTNLKEILSLIKDKNEIIIKKFHIIELLNIFIKICDAMSFACSKGVLHRDLKPENVMIGEFGEVLIVDWGLAKTYQLTLDSGRTYDKTSIIRKIDHFIEENIDTIRSLNKVDLSMDNCLIGTPQYMAPERIIGQGDEKSEVFALGTILHDILALKNMFTAQEVKEVLQKIATGQYEKMQNFNKLPHIPNGKIPQALIAVVEKATQKNPQDRYADIAELKTEIESYVLGYATKAERAGFLRLVKLALKRHKKLSTFVLLLLLTLIFICGVFIYELVHSRQHALNKSNYANVLKETAKRKSEQVALKSKELENKINELRNHADVIFGNAQDNVEQLNFDKALKNITYAIDLQPENEEFRILHGKILLFLLEFDQAAEAFKCVDKDSKYFETALDYYNRSTSLSAKIKQGRFTDNDIIQLYAFFKTRADYAEAIGVLNELKDNESYDKLLTDIWTLRLKKSKISKAIMSPRTVIEAVNGKFRVIINYSNIFDLSPLQNMPIRELSLFGCKINNIDILKGMPLEYLYLSETGVTSLKPITGAPLSELKIRNCNISDITPIKGMKLKSLVLINCPVENIEVLRGMLLDKLNLERTLVSNINALRGMRLRYFNGTHTRIKSIAPLKDMPLKALVMNHSSLNNIGALKTISPEVLEMNGTLISALPEMNVERLERLNISDTTIKDLSRLKDAKKLKDISFSNTQVTNISPLKGIKLNKAHLTGTAVSDISPIASPSLTELHISGSYISDLSSLKNAYNLEILTANNCGISNSSALKGLPLKVLDLSGNLKIDSIETIKSSRLEYLDINGTSVKNIDNLAGAPLRELNISKTPVIDLAFVGTLQKLKKLIMIDSKEVDSLKPLLSVKTLHELKAWPLTKDFILMEKHTSLELIGINHESRTKEIFWPFFKKRFKKILK